MSGKKKVGFRIEGRPTVCKRPRFSRGRVYNDPEHVRSQEYIALQARLAIKDFKLEGPLEMRVYFYFETPKKAPKSVWFTGRPDLSNMIKNIEDALNDIVYKDDSQIVRLISEKQYGSKSFTWVEIEEI